MNTLTQILTELDNQIGFQERNRLGTQERIAAVNQGLQIIYGLLEGSPIIKRSGSTVVDVNNIGTVPTDFNEGIVTYMADTDTFDDSTEVFELDNADFGKVDSTDLDYFTQNYSATSLQFEFNTLASTTLYMEYEMGAPTLVNDSDTDGLSKGGLYIIARLTAGLLNENLLSDEDKMQKFLYGPKGDPRQVAPSSVLGMLNILSRKRQAKAKSTRVTQITITDPARRISNYSPITNAPFKRRRPYGLR